MDKADYIKSRNDRIQVRAGTGLGEKPMNGCIGEKKPAFAGQARYLNGSLCHGASAPRGRWIVGRGEGARFALGQGVGHSMEWLESSRNSPSSIVLDGLFPVFGGTCDSWRWRRLRLLTAIWLVVPNDR